MNDATEIDVLFVDGGRANGKPDDLEFSDLGLTITGETGERFYPWAQIRCVMWNGKRPK